MTARLSPPIALLLVLTSASLAVLIYFGQSFPPVMAVHFNFSGEPDGWIDRVKFIIVASSISFMLPPLIVALMGIMPRVLPPAFMNLPNRDYWMAPARREATLQRLLYFALWLGCLVQGFLIAVHVMIAVANPNGAPAHLSQGHAVVVIGFVFLTLIWVWRITRAFARRRAPR